MSVLAIVIALMGISAMLVSDASDRPLGIAINALTTVASVVIGVGIASGVIPR